MAHDASGSAAPGLLAEARRREQAGDALDSVIAAYEAAAAADPRRAEALLGAARVCRLNKAYEQAYRFAARGMAIPEPPDTPPAEKWIYSFGLADECAVNAYWIGRFEECLRLCEALLGGGALPADMVDRVRANAGFARKAIANGSLLDGVDPGKLRSIAELQPKLRGAAGYSPKKREIVRTIHIVWVGDESRRPERCIESWVRLNPAWNVVIWGNDELRHGQWENRTHIREMLTRELCGVADMMRWEILYHLGGFAIDADTICTRPLEDWLFEPEVFASWENEWTRPGLMANCFVYSLPGNPLIRGIIDEIKRLPSMRDGLAWQITGPVRLTETVKKMNYSGITLYPSHFFMPEHYSGATYTGTGPVFARQFWGGVDDEVYDRLNTLSMEQLGKR